MVKLTFSEDYPRVAPKGMWIKRSSGEVVIFELGQFVTTIFHPNVSPTNGDICVSTLQKDWRPDLGLGHLLLVCVRADHCLLGDLTNFIDHQKLTNDAKSGIGLE